MFFEFNTLTLPDLSRHTEDVIQAKLRAAASAKRVLKVRRTGNGPSLGDAGSGQ